MGRSIFIYLLLAIVLVGGGAVALFMMTMWAAEKQQKGIARDTWQAWAMPEDIYEFPAYAPCGDVVQYYEGRDGERPAYNAVDYRSSLSTADLLRRYTEAMAAKGCDIRRDGNSLKLDKCPGQWKSEFEITLRDGWTCRAVHASWWGGEGG